MPIKLYQRGKVWHYRGTVAGHRLRGSTGTANKELAARIASEVENRHHKRHLDGPQEILMFPQAVALYLKAGKPDKYLGKIEDYWKNAKVKDMTAGAIRQSAIDIYPKAGGATRNRQAITPTQAVINHCAELELCPPIRIKRFKFEQKVKKPVTLEWLNTFCAHARPVIKALVLDMFATACRFAEAHRQDWPDFDFKNQTILIRDTKTKQQRMAHMPQPLLVALANLPRDRKPFHESETTLRRHWDEDAERTAQAVPGFERLTFHCCRHGFATKMLREGVDAKTASTLGGWADIGLFMKTYAHAMQDATITERLFDTPLAQTENDTNKNNGLEQTKDPSGGTAGRVKLYGRVGWMGARAVYSLVGEG
jgi:integrase